MLNEKRSIAGAILSICLRTVANLMIVFLLYESLVQSYTFSYKLFSDVPYVSGQRSVITITIQEGESAKEIAQNLYDNKIIEDQYVFLTRAYIGKYTNKMKAGDYLVNCNMSPDTICKVFCGIQSEDAS
ncbi:MAG: endolytic transglycosylase MltG [Lachnospiraceae bacterium]